MATSLRILNFFTASCGGVGGVSSRITPRPGRVSMIFFTASLPATSSGLTFRESETDGAWR
jgi:hypothetical protein